jgi:hypothetical protein
LSDLELLNCLIARTTDIGRNLVPSEVCLRHCVAGCQKAGAQRSRAAQGAKDDLFARVFPGDDAFD